MNIYSLWDLVQLVGCLKELLCMHKQILRTVFCFSYLVYRIYYFVTVTRFSNTISFLYIKFSFLYLWDRTSVFVTHCKLLLLHICISAGIV